MKPAKHDGIIEVFPLREIFRRLPTNYTWRVNRMRVSSKQVAAMSAMLSTSGNSAIPKDTLRVARKRTRLSGQAVIDFAGNSEIPADSMVDPYVGPFVWVVVQKNDAVKTLTTACARHRAAVPMFLPALDARSDTRLVWKKSVRNAINHKIREFAAEWRESADGRADSAELLATVRAAVAHGLPAFVASVDFYGSRRYGMCSDASDVDIAIDIRRCPAKIVTPRAYLLSAMLRILRSDPAFSNLLALPTARVPILRFRFLASSGRVVVGEISAHGRMGRAKSDLIRAYIDADARVRPVLALLKTWSIGRKINSPRTLNWYGLVMMALAYLVEMRVVPPLQLISPGVMFDEYDRRDIMWRELGLLRDDPDAIAMLDRISLKEGYFFTPLGSPGIGTLLPTCLVDDCNTHFMDDKDALAAWRSPNPRSPISLLYGMFRFYGYDFNPLADAVSLRLGSPQVPRSSLCRLDAPASQTSRTLAIEDPFEVSVNCARLAPPHWVDGLLWEMRRAAWCISRKSPLNGPFTVIDRLALPPSSDVFCDASVWAHAVESVSSQTFAAASASSSSSRAGRYSAGAHSERAAVERLKRNEDLEIELVGAFKIPSSSSVATAEA
ncbi:hypothetical protein LPJ72_006261 [Coemansia sp. Benny D160-2]|nr:hypothetical protein LPJ72_006261 [Coemansia sp. Benny D160-2]